MSNSLAIATVTATLQRLVSAALDVAADSLKVSPGTLSVSTVRPTVGTAGLTKKGVNIYLFQVTPNPSARNDDLPTRRSGGEAVQRPRVAIDLHYLFSFHGADKFWEAQRALGITLQTLHARPVLSREMIAATISALGDSEGFEFMKTSNLADAIEPVRITLETLSLEEISKIWSVLFQTPYDLSVVCRASVVIVEAEETPAPSLPVHAVAVRAVPFAAPWVGEVTNAARHVPIVGDSTLSVRGRALRGDVTQVVIDGVPAPNGPDFLGDAELRFDLGGLPAPLAAGVHGLQVAHAVQVGEPPSSRLGSSSNVVPFVVHPRVTAVATGPLTTKTVAGETLCTGRVTLTFGAAVGRAQRAVVLLSRVSPAASPRAYAFEAKPRPSGPADPLTTLTIDFDVADVSAGTYAVRAQIDGADSALVAAAEDYPRVTLS
ncbi:hypothetical protein sce2089 [Sorangium cellulosum So ce56]|uniref:Pvc16 N-terminal domain-containing protein n=1 Tax=Sorangium cellulosum (strain So ce56) TaxID=448385 RepID=A9FV85_SORC5|nr:DUF4255 domain-containing protein [Sorangium cellulosum]CAN92248.1 hypothetical protein sce2089 [Sorangium cellulosum So ce56]